MRNNIVVDEPEVDNSKLVPEHFQVAIVAGQVFVDDKKLAVSSGAGWTGTEGDDGLDDFLRCRSSTSRRSVSKNRPSGRP